MHPFSFPRPFRPLSRVSFFVHFDPSSRIPLPDPRFSCLFPPCALFFLRDTFRQQRPWCPSSLPCHPSFLRLAACQNINFLPLILFARQLNAPSLQPWPPFVRSPRILCLPDVTSLPTGRSLPQDKGSQHPSARDGAPSPGSPT